MHFFGFSSFLLQSYTIRSMEFTGNALTISIHGKTLKHFGDIFHTFEFRKIIFRFERRRFLLGLWRTEKQKSMRQRRDNLHEMSTCSQLTILLRQQAQSDTMLIQYGTRATYVPILAFSLT